jgi:poly-gamma-glutamate capsule biosynthesis protein CapA/YwtB (metallophosphatase superfamily)
VRAADEVADIVVVIVHWGHELDTIPRADDIERANAMIEAGADIIFGGHSHRLQPLDLVEGAPVFWSLGNFVWPHLSEPSATTAVARVVVSPDGSMDACLIPAYIESHGHPVLTAEPTCGPPA